MKLFGRKEEQVAVVPPELEQYYQVPHMHTTKDRRWPVILALTVVFVVAVIAAGVTVVVIRHNHDSSTQSKPTVTTKPATKPKTTTNINTQPVIQPSVQ